MTQDTSLEFPILDKSTPGSGSKHEARRHRRHLRKGPVTTNERVEMALKNNTQSRDVDDEGETEDDEENAQEVQSSEMQGIGSPEENRTSREIVKSYGHVSDNVKSSLVTALEKDQSRRRHGVGSEDSSVSSYASSASTDDIDPDVKKQIAEALNKAASRDRSDVPSASSYASSAHQEGDAEADVEVSKQIATALEKARRQREIQDSNEGKEEGNHDISLQSSLEVVDKEEAEKLFPNEESLSMIAQEEGARATEGDTTATSLDADAAAWDANGVSGMESVLENFKASNRTSVEAGDVTPLFDLETISSCGNNNDKGLEGDISSSSLAKMSSQRERMALYTSGEGFGVGEDSSVDNNENESQHSENDDGGDKDVGDKALFDYEVMNNIMDDADECDDDDAAEEALEEFRSVQSDDDGRSPPQFSPSGGESRTNRWDRNPDAISDVGDDESELFDGKSGVTGVTTEGSGIVGLRFVGSSTPSTTGYSSSSAQQHPTSSPPPPKSSFDFADADANSQDGHFFFS